MYARITLTAVWWLGAQTLARIVLHSPAVAVCAVGCAPVLAVAPVRLCLWAVASFGLHASHAP